MLIPPTKLFKTSVCIAMALLFSCSGKKQRIVAETNTPLHTRIIETTVWAKPGEDPYAFLKKKHRLYELEIKNDSTQRFQIDYERAFHDPLPWQLISSKEMVAFKKGDDPWTILPLIATRCMIRIESFDPKGELTLEKYAYYWMGCEPVLMVKNVSAAKAIEILEQTWAEPYDGYEIPKDPWMDAYQLVSEESQKKIRSKMIEIYSSLKPEEKENASPDFSRRLKLLKELAD